MQYAKRFLNRYAQLQAIEKVKEKIGDDIAMLGGLLFIFWFMYIAMLPIM